jgi:hypothetical protein
MNVAAPVAQASAPPVRAAAPPQAPVAAAPAAAPVPAPATAVAIADAPELDARIEGCWTATVAAVNSRKRMIGAFLEQSRLMGCTATHLVLAMDDMHRSVLNDGEIRQMMREELARAFGKPLDIRIEALAPGDAPKRATEKDVKPMIDRAIAFFDGEIIEKDPNRPVARAPERGKEFWRNRKGSGE